MRDKNSINELVVDEKNRAIMLAWKGAAQNILRKQKKAAADAASAQLVASIEREQPAAMPPPIVATSDHQENYSETSDITAGTTIDRPVGKTRVCHLFMRNAKCYRGDKCKYIHSASSVLQTGMCFEFQSGACLWGDSCRFKHNMSQGSPIKLLAAEPEDALEHPALAAAGKKKRKKNKNKNKNKNRAAGDDASQVESTVPVETKQSPNAEGMVKLRTVPAVVPDASPVRKPRRKICIQFRRSGTCSDGDLCEYMHRARDAIRDASRVASETWGSTEQDVSEPDATSADLVEASPLRESKSPVRDAKTPTRDVKSPVRDAKTPTRDVKSPVRGAKTPTRDVKSPVRDAKTPTRDVKSPVREGRTPKTGGKTPQIKACFAFRLNGKCQYGDECKFAHRAAKPGGMDDSDLLDDYDDYDDDDDDDDELGQGLMLQELQFNNPDSTVSSPVASVSKATTAFSTETAHPKTHKTPKKAPSPPLDHLDQDNGAREGLPTSFPDTWSDVIPFPQGTPTSVKQAEKEQAKLRAAARIRSDTSWIKNSREKSLSPVRKGFSTPKNSRSAGATPHTPVGADGISPPRSKFDISNL